MWGNICQKYLGFWGIYQVSSESYGNYVLTWKIITVLYFVELYLWINPWPIIYGWGVTCEGVII